MATDVEVPALGESITEGTLAQWLKKPGEAVAADEPIASLETDKVSVEVPSPIAGVLTEQLAQEGDTVAVGAVIARIGEGAVAAANWAFDTLGWSSVIHSIAPANLASQRVAQKLGSRNLGPGKLPPPYQDDRVDIWGQTREEWRRLNP